MQIPSMSMALNKDVLIEHCFEKMNFDALKIQQLESQLFSIKVENEINRTAAENGNRVVKELKNDHTNKVREVIEYCQPHLLTMWSAKVVGTLLGCDFRDSESEANKFLSENKK